MSDTETDQTVSDLSGLFLQKERIQDPAVCEGFRQEIEESIKTVSEQGDDLEETGESIEEAIGIFVKDDPKKMKEMKCKSGENMV